MVAGLGCYRELKSYRESDMAAAFGTGLWLAGATAVPNLLLRHYRRIGLTDQEMMLVIQLMRLRVEEGLLNPEAGHLTECTGLSPAEVELATRALLEKGFLGRSRYYDTRSAEVVEGYDFGPLFTKLAAVWAGLKMEEELEARRLMEEAASGDLLPKDEKSIYLAFEKEFGRLFTPIEIEKIKQWLAEVSPVLVMEALRQAVLRGKHNLKYIDSIIIEWQKNNLRTVEEIRAYDQKFRNRRKTRSSGEAGKQAEEDAEARRKELLNTIFVG